MTFHKRQDDMFVVRAVLDRHVQLSANERLVNLDLEPVPPIGARPPTRIASRRRCIMNQVIL